MEMIRSQKGAPKLAYGGYLYVKNKQLADGGFSYECHRRRTTSICKGRVRVTGNQVQVVIEHTHEPERGAIGAAKAVADMKARARTTEETPQVIVTNQLLQITEGAAAKLPNLKTMRRNIRRHRQQANNPLPVPMQRADLPHPLPNEYQTLENGDQFLIYDSGDEERILIFGTHAGMQLLAASDHWFMDGTFKTVPSIYMQLYTIHAMYEGHIVPAIFAFLPDKRLDTYRRMLGALVAYNIDDDLNPTSVMIDFELAAKRALSEVFPAAQIKGCFFHFSQAIYRRLAATGLEQVYRENEEIAIQARMLAALAFVPDADIDAAFRDLSANLPDELQPLADYVEDTFIGGMRRDRMRPPMFPRTLWGMHARVGEDLPRTNNSVEGWHSGLALNAGGHHLNFWKYIGVLKREEALNSVRRTHILQGRRPPPPHFRYANLNDRIRNLVDNYAGRNILDYLRGVAYNFNW